MCSPEGVIYIFNFGSYFKVGYAAVCPYQRLALGYWHCKHPRELCGQLERCSLLCLYAGSLALEQAVHAALGPDCGEFYLAARLPEVLHFLALVLEPLPLPEDPQLTPQTPKLKPCCGGSRHGFQRLEHASRSFTTAGRTAPCPRCGRVVSVRKDKLKEHQQRASCGRG